MNLWNYVNTLWYNNYVILSHPHHFKFFNFEIFDRNGLCDRHDFLYFCVDPDFTDYVKISSSWVMGMSSFFTGRAYWLSELSLRPNGFLLAFISSYSFQYKISCEYKLVMEFDESLPTVPGRLICLTAWDSFFLTNPPDGLFLLGTFFKFDKNSRSPNFSF